MAGDSTAGEVAQPELLTAPREGVPPLIARADALRSIADTLQIGTGPVAVDTERAQGYRYGTGAYLVQLRRPGSGSFLIDTHAIPDLSPLASVLDQEWILHAADQDLLCMRALGVSPQSVFDTEVAARLLGLERFSLGAVTEQVLGVTLKKNHQNEDWSLRPLPADWLRYAALDVELLPELRSSLHNRLSDAGRIGWAEEEFDHLLTHPLKPRDPHWRDMKGLGRVRTPLGMAIARELWEVRDRIGRAKDVAPGRILATRGIIDAAVLNPLTKRKLTSIEEFRRPRARAHLDQWWKALAKARSVHERDLPRVKLPPDPNFVPVAATWKRSDPQAWERLQAMRALVARVASPLGIQPDVVLEPRVQREVTWRPLNVDFDEALAGAGARPWQIGKVLEATDRRILSVLQTDSA